MCTSITGFQNQVSLDAYKKDELSLGRSFADCSSGLSETSKSFQSNKPLEAGPSATKRVFQNWYEIRLESNFFVTTAKAVVKIGLWLMTIATGGLIYLGLYAVQKVRDHLSNE